MAEFNFDELFEFQGAFCENTMPFNKLPGTQIETLTLDTAVVKSAMKGELVANPHKHNL